MLRFLLDFAHPLCERHPIHLAGFATDQACNLCYVLGIFDGSNTQQNIQIRPISIDKSVHPELVPVNSLLF